MHATASSNPYVAILLDVNRSIFSFPARCAFFVFSCLRAILLSQGGAPAPPESVKGDALCGTTSQKSAYFTSSNAQTADMACILKMNTLAIMLPLVPLLITFVRFVLIAMIGTNMNLTLVSHILRICLNGIAAKYGYQSLARIVVVFNDNTGLSCLVGITHKPCFLH